MFDESTIGEHPNTPAEHRGELEMRIDKRVMRVMELAADRDEYEPEFIAACFEVAENAALNDLAKWFRAAMINHYDLESEIEEQVAKVVRRAMEKRP